MFTYVVVGALALLVIAAAWVQFRGRNRPDRHISQNAPMDDSMNAQARWQVDANSSPWNSGGAG